MTRPREGGSRRARGPQVTGTVVELARGAASGNGDDAPESTDGPMSGPSEDAIRVRAYEIFLRREGGPGNALEDWLAAERALGTAAPGELS